MPEETEILDKLIAFCDERIKETEEYKKSLSVETPMSVFCKALLSAYGEIKTKIEEEQKILN